MKEQHFMNITSEQYSQLNQANNGGTIHATQNVNININSIEILKDFLKNNEANISPEVNEKDFEDFPDEQIQYYKSQLGDRLVGNESNFEIIAAFLKEADDTLQTEKRFGCMPVFLDMLPREITEGYLYLNHNLVSFDQIEIEKYCWETVERYQINSKYYYISFMYEDGKIIQCQFGYDLNFEDVEERLYGFQFAKRILESKLVRIKIKNTQNELLLEPSILGKDGAEQLTKTNEWMEVMKKISVIEQKFAIKFSLPPAVKSKELEYINMIYDSAMGNANFIVDGIPDQNPECEKYEMPEIETMLEAPENCMRLFGYVFSKVKVIIPSCTLTWYKKEKMWKCNSDGIFAKIILNCKKEN